MRLSNKNYYSVISAVAICFALSIFSFKASSQTAMFGVNPQHTGVYIASTPTDLMLVKKWKYKTNGMIFSSAVVVNNVIYIGSDDSCLYAIKTDGTIKWKFKSNGIIRSTPAVKDTIAYFNNYSGRLYAVGVNTGSELWNFDTDGEQHFSDIGLFGWTPSDQLMDDPWDFYTSSPAITDTIIYFGSGNNVYAINFKGEQIWKYATNDVIHSTPAISNNIICFGGWSGTFYALDALTGDEKWNYSTGTDPTHLMQGIQSSPSIIDTLVIIGARSSKVCALNINSGGIIWSSSFGGSWMPSSFAHFNETLFTGSSEAGGLKALNLSDGIMKYATSNNFYFTFSSPALANEVAYIGCLNGSLFAVNINTGQIICRFDTDGRNMDPLNAILDNGTLNPDVFNPVSGYPYVEAVEYVRRLLTAGSIASTPSVNENVIYFGSSDSCIYAVHDTGGCKPKIQVFTSLIDLGSNRKSTSVDSFFYVSNIGECIDSIKIYVPENLSATIKNSIEINPSEIVIPTGDSMKINITINPSELAAKSYKIRLTSQSKTNEYQSGNTDIIFKVLNNAGIDDLDSKKVTAFYPNPFNDFINIEANFKSTITIINSVGLVVFQKKLSGLETKIDLSNLQSGIFLIIFNSGNEIYSSKIIKN